MTIHRALSLLAVLLSVALLTACNRDNKPVVFTSDGDSTFEYDAYYDDDNDVEEWELLFRDPEAEVEVETIDLDGQVVVEIFDDDNDRVFLKTYDGPANGREIDFDDSDRGEQGVWTIRITTIDATGRIRIFIEPQWEEYEAPRG